MGVTTSAFNLHLQASFLQSLLFKLWKTLILVREYQFQQLSHTHAGPLKLGKAEMNGPISVRAQIPRHVEVFSQTCRWC